METIEAAGCLEALSNPTRLNIYQYLIRAGTTGSPVGEIQSQFDIPGSTLSHHIARLVRSNLVIQERQSRTLICRANYQVMQEIIQFLTESCCVDQKSC